MAKKIVIEEGKLAVERPFEDSTLVQIRKRNPLGETQSIMLTEQELLDVMLAIKELGVEV